MTQSYVASQGITNDLPDELEDATKGVSLLSGVQANAAGAITARTLSTGIAETRTFNQRNQLTRIAAAAGGATILDLGYGYGTTNNNGKIRSRTDAVQPEHSASYTFDEIGRLKEVSGTAASWGISWTLDRYSNRTAQTPTGLASGLGSPNSFYGSPTTNRDAAFTYDNAGNLTDDGPNTYYYDAESRLYKINSTDVQYGYDYAGRRIKRTVGSATTYYFYGLTGLMSEFSTTSGASGAAASDRLQYRVGEQTGTAVMLVDAGGTPRENNRVFPFGEPFGQFAGSTNTEKFTTYQRDDANGEAGLDYAMARYYVSKSGRFMTPDPGHIGAAANDPQSWNAYLYGWNDPINATDPLGLFGLQQGEEIDPERVCVQNEDGTYSSACPHVGGDTGYTVRTIIDTIGQGVKRIAEIMPQPQPPDQRCVATAAGSGMVLGGGLGTIAGLLGIFTGPGVLATAPGGAVLGAGSGFFIGGAVGSVTCRFMSGNETGGSTSNQSKYDPTITKPGSVRNVQTNVRAVDFGRNLEANGFTKSVSKNGGALLYTKGNMTYSVYAKAKSTGGVSAQLTVNGDLVLKIRLLQ